MTPHAALIIDPLLASTFLGGTNSASDTRIALDSSGNVYVTGKTGSSDFPTTAGAYDTSYNGGVDVFIAKLNNALSTLLASTFLGGTNYDYAYGITVDSSGNIYITGGTGSSDFPTTAGAYDTSDNGGDDGFIAKLNSALSTLLASTLLGGTNNDYVYGIALDSSGNVYVRGGTNSPDFPTTAGAYNTSYNSSNYYSDGFIAKLNSALSTLLASTLLGGTGNDYVYGIALDSSGNVYVTGGTDSFDFPTTAGAYDTSYNGYYNDGFIAKLNSALSALLASTFLGGTGYDCGYGIALDSSGNVYVTGGTDSFDFPTTAGAYDSSDNGGDDVFIAKLNSTLSALLASTFLGGTYDDSVSGIALDSSGNVYVTGYTYSYDFPTTAGAYDTSYNDNYYSDVFIAKLNSALSALLASTFLGGTWSDGVDGIAVDSSGTVYVTGTTGSEDFPWTAGAYDTSFNGDDVFIAKLDGNLSGNDGQGNAGVWGHVKDVDGNRITGVNVTVNLTGPANRQVTYSDGRYFAFTNIAAGAYTIEATTSDGRASGPQRITLTDLIISTIDLTVRQQVCNPGGRIPILLVPGIMGSTTGGLWKIPVLPKQAPAYNDPKWNTNDHAYHGLYDDGVGWKQLAETLHNNFGYEIGCTLFPVPYDWRMEIQDAASQYLKRWINEAKSRTGANKVNIIAHSMGGLVTRAYIQSDYYGNDIDKFAMVGTPNHGAVMSYFLWQGGDPVQADAISFWSRFSPPAYDAVAWSQYPLFYYYMPPTLYQPAFYRLFHQHTQSMKQLLPTFPFLNDRALSCSGESNGWLNALNTNSNRYKMGKENESGKVRTKVFAGSDQKTVLALQVSDKHCWLPLYKDGVPLGYQGVRAGDGTVPTSSAYVDFASFTTKSGEHMGLIDTYRPELIQFIDPPRSAASQMTTDETLRSGINQAGSITYELAVVVLGRAQPYLINPAGQKLGINPQTSIGVNEIPNSDITADDTGTTLVLPDAVAGTYSLTLKDGYSEDYLLTLHYTDQGGRLPGLFNSP